VRSPGSHDQTTQLGDDGALAPEGEAHVVVADGDRLSAIPVPADRPLVVGRAEDADVVLGDTRASRHHATVAIKGGQIFVRDLDSRNGTRLGGAIVRGEERRVHPGDVITIGSATLTITSSGFASSVARPTPAEAAAEPTDTGPFVVADPKMLAVLRVAQRFARVDTPVLVLGETGVGKEVVAAQLHSMSPRRSGPFVSLNCAALPDAIVDAELFGYERGAFTGAERRKTGYLEAAQGGTLLLDELGDIPLATQVKLLRFLETKRLTRLGSTDEIAVDVRIVAATHRVLAEAIRAGRFREDLYYRLSACTLRLPPLRERPSEIASFAALFARAAAAKLGQPPPVFEPEAVALLLGYAWPGNVRELKNAVEHAVVMTDGRTVLAESFPEAVRGVGPARTTAAGGGALPAALADIERDRIVAALREENGNQTRAAARLGISRRALLYKIDKYEIRKERPAR
jgi:transcriptional regulator with PAS, ATPase and Fis domain